MRLNYNISILLSFSVIVHELFSVKSLTNLIFFYFFNWTESQKSFYW